MLPNRPLIILVIGSGGREHALCWKLAQSPLARAIYCAPGNGGTATTDKTRNVNIQVMDFPAIADFCLKQEVDLVVVGPDNPLAEGITDYLQERRIRVFGPNKLAARLESSKAFAKDFMAEVGIPTARYVVCSSLEEGRNLLKRNPWARVVKVDGLALGKGVFVCDSEDEAIAALTTIFQQKSFGEAGSKVILEERLVGEEISLLCLCDGKTLIPLLPSQDHKRRFDGDTGPNTGGMGAYAPVDLYQSCESEIEATILTPLRSALTREPLLLGTHFQGVLYLGLLVTLNDGKYNPYVLEFNARFGDPETQVLLPLMSSDLLAVLWSCTDASLHDCEIQWSGKSGCCVVATSENYPEGSSRDKPISVGELSEDCVVFQAGTALSGSQLLTNGGRILAITGSGNTLTEAADLAYQAIKSIEFSGMSYRRDIARRIQASCPSG